MAGAVANGQKFSTMLSQQMKHEMAVQRRWSAGIESNTDAAHPQAFRTTLRCETVCHNRCTVTCTVALAVASLMSVLHALSC